MTERDLQTAVIEAAHLLGWHIAHFRPAHTARGWRTPVEADGAGFPDLVMIHPRGGLLIRELKAAKGQVSPEQAVWLDLFKRARLDGGVWRTDDWLTGAVELELRLSVTNMREDLMRVGLLAVSDRADGCVPRANGLRIREIVSARCWPQKEE